MNEDDRFRTAWLFFSIGLALSSGVAQLVATGVGRIVLAAVFLSSIALLIGRVARDRLSLKAKVARERESLREALQYVMEASDASFSEEFNLNIHIGSSDAGDKVRCEVVTIPEGPLRYRSFYPFVSNEPNAPDIENMRFAGEVLSPFGTSVELIPLRADRWVRVAALFRPVLKAPCRWVVEYRVPGFWRPLRVRGRDTLKWSLRHEPSGNDATVTDFVITFFPPSGTILHVAERSRRGSISSNLDSSGDASTTWRINGSRAGDIFFFDVLAIKKNPV
ncbi:hypothetical protein [Jidongwangia harbinensis]|uniref:hypothetical protein n=1 Tax=Jidongwangia harbinensis TaxID=2878561 RepID=UPI001CDA0A83|nr:hypothetical protein [Jidongwangia harbinensis]MCA2215716.1 hypothetical protein [Jidongwangia harbinensis]